MNQPPEGPGAGPIARMAHNPVAANLIMVLLLGGGLWTASQIQKEVEPEYELDVVSVSVGYPGAAPGDVEQGILLPVEEAVRGVQGIEEIASTAREGWGSVEIELVAGADRMRVFQDIDQAVSRIRTFPDDIEQPEVRLSARTRQVMYVGLHGDIDVWSLRGLAEGLRDQLLTDRRITQVELNRVPEYVTHVEIPMARLREHGITLGEVASTIANSSEEIPAGAIETDAGEILLRMHERKQWAEELGRIPILTADSGATLELADLAIITDGFEESAFPSQFNQTPSVGVSIYRVGDQSPLGIATAVREVIADYRTTLPPGVELRVDSSAADDFEDRLSLLVENGLLAVVIVLVILSFFLELRLAFWVMMGMAVSFVGGLMVMPAADVSINMISMFGFLVVLGIVVDDAIVVGESVYQQRERGVPPLRAAIDGTREVARPVVFSVLTTVMAFVPLMFIPGTTGKYWWPLPVVVIVVLFVSLFEALFILPAHLAHERKRVAAAEARINRWQRSFSTRVSRAIERYYQPVLERCLRARYVTVATAAALLAVIGAYAASDHMGMIMMPEVAADEIEAGVRLPVGTTPEQAARVANAVTAATRRMFDEHGLDSVAEGIKTNVRGGSFVDVELVMKPPDERTMTANEVIELWREEIGDIDGVHQITFEAERGPGGWRQDIAVDLSHSDEDMLERAAMAFVERAEGYAATRDVNDNYDRGKTQFDLRLRPEGRALGFTVSGVGRQVRDAFFGALAQRHLRGTNEVEVRVKLPEHEREDLQYFTDFVVRAPDGTEVPLGEVVDVRSGKAFNSISRRNGRRVISVGMNVEPKSAMNRVLEALERDELQPLRSEFPGLTWSFEGTQAEMRESTQALYGGFALAIAVIYGLLAIALRSYVQPLIVMVAIPFGIVGAVIGHILLGYDLSLVSLMGVIALAGVVVNDSLLMIDFANRHRREANGRDRSAFEAIRQAGLRRIRPIVLTTLTTFGGLMPIIMETSNQARHLIPMALSLGFGIIFATGLILLVVPSLYLIVDDLLSRGAAAQPSG